MTGSGVGCWRASCPWAQTDVYVCVPGPADCCFILSIHVWRRCVPHAPSAGIHFQLALPPCWFLMLFFSCIVFQFVILIWKQKHNKIWHTSIFFILCGVLSIIINFYSSYFCLSLYVELRDRFYKYFMLTVISQILQTLWMCMTMQSGAVRFC